MIGETGFTILLVAIWLSAFGFGSVVIYWFVRQGFAEKGVVKGTDFPPEPPAVTKRSLLIWAGVFAVLFVVIVVGG